MTDLRAYHFGPMIDEICIDYRPEPEWSLPGFDGALDEREARLHLPRHPVTGIRMSPGDVVTSGSDSHPRSRNPGSNKDQGDNTGRHDKDPT